MNISLVRAGLLRDGVSWAWTLLSIIGICLVISPPCRAEQFALSGFYETGKRSQAEDYEEEENDSNYTFQKYHIRLQHRVSEGLEYEFGSFINEKDYAGRDDLDNYSRLFHVRAGFSFKEEKKAYSNIDVKLKYKVKRYEETPSSEYNQIAFAPRITFVRKNHSILKISGGINSYDYRSSGSRDQFKFFSKLDIRRYFFEKNLTLLSSYKFETAAQTKKDTNKNKNDLLIGLDYRTNISLLQKVSARFGLGQRDTKDDDRRDEDFDYTFRRLYVKTEHRLSSAIKTGITYQYFKKDYVSADLDHSGFYLLSSWRIKIFSDSMQEVYCNFSAKHKNVDYTDKRESDYRKDTLIASGTYKRKKNWKAAVSLQGSFYNHDNSGNDKNRYYTRVSFEKYFLSRTLTASLYLKYKHTDYRERNDTDEGSMRTSLLYKF